MAKITKAQNGYKGKKTVDPKLRKMMMDLGAKSDSLASEALKKGPIKGEKDRKAAGVARQKEINLAKKLYGTAPSERYKKGGTIKKMQAAGVAGKQPKAGMVDPKGAYTKVQERTLGNMKGGGMMTAKGGKWIQKAIKKPGALRAQLGAKPGKPIPAGKLAKAAKAKGKLGQRARLAMTLNKIKNKQS